MADATRILDYLFQGSYQNSLRERQSGALGITHILNVKESAKFIEDDPLATLHVPLSDYGETDLRTIFPECFQFIEECRTGGGKVLVHCRSGQNRSTAVVVGYLTFVRGMTLRQSWELVTELRPFVTIAEPYWQQLEALEKELKNESTFSYEEIKAQLRAELEKIK